MTAAGAVAAAGAARGASGFGGPVSFGDVALALVLVAVALGPEVLALDEPTSALDTASKAGIEELVVGLARSGLTVVMVTHEPRHSDLADHVVTVEPLSREDGR